MLTLVACCLEFQPLLNLTMTPLKRNSCGASLIATDLSEFWYTMIFFCGYISFFWGFPFLIYQIRCFIVPALIDLESRKILQLLKISFFAFLIVSWLVNSTIAPFVIDFLFIHQIQSLEMNIQCLPKLATYCLFFMKLYLWCLLVAQLPAGLLLCIEFGLFSTVFLKSSRRFIYVVIVGLSAFFSPPDITSQFFLSSILFCFYEFCTFYTIWWVLYKSKQTDQ